jgi:UDP-N-acetylglucosamine 4-epimerase
MTAPWEVAVSARARTWLVTGGAGFIGSHLVAHLLRLGQRVRVLDNFATGHRANLEAVAGEGPAGSLEVVEGDLRDPDACADACRGAELVLHQAALGSVPRSISDPLATHAVNVTGFLNVLQSARGAGIRRIVYASSSSVYGDHPALPKVEEQVGRQLSPYAVSKFSDELYARVFGPTYGLELIGLRYFNVFGPRQDPSGPYAAVIPLWFQALLEGRAPAVNGDGSTSRDFCFVENVVQANLLAATVERSEAVGEVYNVAVGERTTLLQLLGLMRSAIAELRPDLTFRAPEHRGFRAGDIQHSLADISKARRLLGYQPGVTVRDGVRASAAWYARRPSA